MTDRPRLSIVIPIYNERDTWRDLLARVQTVALPDVRKQLILVDDGSTDGTREQLLELDQADDLKVILHPHNQGKGAAVRTGFDAADGDFVVIQDADLEYDPHDFNRLLPPLLAGEVDVVYGSRFRCGRPECTYWANYLANRFLTMLSNVTTGWRLTDMETCYKMVRRDVLRQLRLEQNRFGFEPEITAKLSQLGARLRELPIWYQGRTHSEGKKIGWRDGLQAIRCILKYGLGLQSRRCNSGGNA